MEVKYIVIDLSKIDGDKLSEMLEKAYKDGYQKGRECIGSINAPAIPYVGDYYTTTTTGMAICADNNLNSNTIVVNGNSISSIKESAISSISNEVSN